MSEEFEEGFEENEFTSKTQVLPAFEIIKRDILFSWFDIERQYKEYIRATSLNKQARTESLSSSIIALYITILKPMMNKKRFKETFGSFVGEMEVYITEEHKIPEDKIHYVMNELAEFLHEIKLTDITFEIKPWDERFRDSYGVF